MNQTAAAVERERYMDAEEAQRLRTVTEARAITDKARGRVGGVVAWAVVDTALSTGLRVSELARIRHGDIDLRRGSLKAWRMKRQKPGRETMALGRELAAHLRDFTEWKEAADQPTGKEDALFHGKRGAMTARGLQQCFKAAVGRAGLPPELSIHSARHTLAVHLLKKTANLRMVQKQLGHSSPATTANLYADVPFADMRDGLSGVYGSEQEAEGQ